MKSSEQSINIQDAISDIAIIKQVLNQKEKDIIDSKLVGITLNANLLLQSIALFFVLLLCLTELATNGSMTSTLMTVSQYDDLKVYGIGFMGAILIGLLIPFQFIIWRAAKHNNEDIATYVFRNFKYLKNLSFFSDLLMKFIGIALLVLAGKPEWISPLLCAYIGDYLLQHRFFTFSVRVSAILGITCVAIASALFINGNFTLIIPLATFAIISVFSLSRLVLKYRQQTTTNN